MLVTMSNKKLHYLTMYCAAERPEISDRQCRRLIVRYREEVPHSLTHKRCSSRYNQQLRQGWLNWRWNLSERAMLSLNPG